jgi:hypothetical protein
MPIALIEAQIRSEGSGPCRGQPEVAHRARDVQQVDRLVADDPGVMPRRDVEHVARLEHGLLAIVHPGAEPAREEHLNVMDHAPLRAHRRLDVH